jgi:hypothetical protein
MITNHIPNSPLLVVDNLFFVLVFEIFWEFQTEKMPLMANGNNSVIIFVVAVYFAKKLKE